MSPLALIVMFGWIPAVLYIFMRFPAQRAIVISFLVAWLFLPTASFPIPGFPDYTKISATCYGILLATIIYDVGRFSSFKLGWLDIPMLIWCLCPIASSFANGLGAYDGIVTALGQTVTWGLPYFLGRIYLNNLAGLRELAISIFIGGLIYAPLCLFEVRMSQNLHRVFYGFNTEASSYLISLRYGGYRPSVFMESGLMVGAWMMAASLSGIWLWRTGVIKQLWGISIKWLLIVLIVTFVSVKATGAWFLLIVGVVVLFIGQWFRTAFVLFLVIATISSYLFVAITGTFVGDQIVTSMNGVFPKDRVESLEFRFNNEELLSDKARERIVFGWAGWGRNRIYNEWGEDISITDSLWIIAFGINGAVGVISLTASLLLPVVAFLRSFPATTWTNRKVAPAAALAVLLTLYMVDCLLNAMINPIYALACGGIAGTALKPTRAASSNMHIRSSVTTQRHLVQQRQRQNNLLKPSKSGRQIN